MTASANKSRRAWTWSVVFLVLSPFLAGTGASLAAQDGPDRLQIRANATARVYDNFFRAPPAGSHQTILAWTGGARVGLRPVVSPVIELYGEADYTRYGDLGDSPGLGGGVFLWSRTHVSWLEVHRLQNRPVFDVGDVTRFADLSRISGYYSFRPGSDWRFDLDGRTVHVRFDEVPQANSRVYLIGGSIRYRALDFLQPELGGRVGKRVAEDPDQDNTRGHLSLGIVSVPADPLRMNVRYRFRSRWYTGDDPQARNFGRSDTGGQWTVVSVLRASRRLQFRLIYNRMDLDSTLEQRIYSSQSLALGTVVRF